MYHGRVKYPGQEEEPRAGRQPTVGTAAEESSSRDSESRPDPGTPEAETTLSLVRSPKA